MIASVALIAVRFPSPASVRESRRDRKQETEPDTGKPPETEPDTAPAAPIVDPPNSEEFSYPAGPALEILADVAGRRQGCQFFNYLIHECCLFKSWVPGASGVSGASLLLASENGADFPIGHKLFEPWPARA